MLQREIKAVVARRRARGNIVIKKGFVVSAEEREQRRKRAEHTPHLDKLLSHSANS